ncbi:hypothetical protein F5Y00DRAFT_269789 [Daldinia vernicosa]|uniref:uncharacterized protein n=1 Tax=Daldinia vernicosa TaxID=114800 RepID=UPI0020077FFB|nr:uncharacterized protein F5Y00DRAFT_269789 [Daldinia vernicosa]KAI0849157.1 hypothetical protein F5Y00DRAFT_269789 [Daldinia vernicosa]
MEHCTSISSIMEYSKHSFVQEEIKKEHDIEAFTFPNNIPSHEHVDFGVRPLDFVPEQQSPAIGTVMTGTHMTTAGESLQPDYDSHFILKPQYVPNFTTLAMGSNGGSPGILGPSDDVKENIRMVDTSSNYDEPSTALDKYILVRQGWCDKCNKWKPFDTLRRHKGNCRGSTADSKIENRGTKRRHRGELSVENTLVKRELEVITAELYEERCRRQKAEEEARDAKKSKEELEELAEALRCCEEKLEKEMMTSERYLRIIENNIGQIDHNGNKVS